MEEKEVKKNNKKIDDIEKIKAELKEELKKEMFDELKKEQKIESNEKKFDEKAKETFKKIMDTEDNTKDYDKKDIEQNKGMAILSYFGFLCLVPYLAAKESKFAQFHAKQGFNLFIIELIVSGVSYFMNSIVQIPKLCTLFGDTAYECGIYTPWWITLPFDLMEVIIFAIAVIGIVYASKGYAKKLPIMDKIKIIN